MAFPTGGLIRVIQYLALAALAFFCVLMVQIILQYYPINTDVGFLQIKQDYIENTPWLIAFFIHVFSSLFALIAGFTQFSKTIRLKHKKIHRSMGMLYVLNVLFITGPAGLIMSFYANGGLSSRIAFVCCPVYGGGLPGKHGRQSAIKTSAAIKHSCCAVMP